MKRNLLLVLIIALSLPILGNPVDENTAKQLAQNFWKENNIMGVRGDKVFKKKMGDARFVNVATRCGYSEFYIFNNEDGKGFVIIAADDCVTPILGYSYDNNFATENLPPNLKGWLDGYAEQIRAAVEMRATATEEIRNEWECLRQGKNLPIKSETAVSPLITTYWDQGYPYNYYCPYNSLTGETTYTGCVATAMAQIMKYWNYPTHGNGSHSYSDWFYGNISANFGNTTYLWSSMPSRLYSSSSQSQINAIATLMYHCGVSVEMNYGIDGSSASVVYNDYDGYHTYCAENALKNYFGYNSVIGRKRTGYYSDSEWINLLKWDLDDSIAILYKGQGSGGHAFVCDGYNYNNYFHFNWGWSGAADAYYYINNLNPNSNNFSDYQSAVFGICPPINYISASSSPSEGGSVTGSGFYFTNRSCTLHASANAGYSFVNWTENGTQVSTNATYTFNVTRDRDLKANFQRASYSITTTANPTNGGSGIPVGGNTYHYGQTCTVRAVANTDFVFVNWTEDGTQVSSNANYTFTVTGNRRLVANFQRKNYSITTAANPTNGGSGTPIGGNTYQYGQTCTVKAVANSGYVFVNWTEDGVQVSSNANYTFTVTGNRNLVANFQAQQYTIKVSANPSNGGSVSGGGNYNHGSSCTVHATPNSGYAFANWTLNGHQVSDNANLTFTVSSNQNLVAYFVQGAHTINATAGSNGSINPSGNVIIADGGEQTFTIIPDQDYEIKEVYIDGSAIGSTSTYTFTNVTEDHKIYATFSKMIGVEEDFITKSVVYPNPTSGMVTIICQDAEQLNVYNTVGQLLFHQNTKNNEQVSIDMSDFPYGLYLVQMIGGNRTITKQIIKNQ